MPLTPDEAMAAMRAAFPDRYCPVCGATACATYPAKRRCAQGHEWPRTPATLAAVRAAIETESP